MRSFWLLFFSITFSFFAVYTIIWAILEPIPISDSYNQYRFIFIVLTSSIIASAGLSKRGLMSYLFYRHIRPLIINKLQIFSTRINDDSLVEGWKLNNSIGEARYPKTVEDFLFEKVCKFEDKYTHDAFHGISVIAKEKGSKIDYFIKPISDTAPVIYVRIEVKNLSTNKPEFKWLTLVIEKVHITESHTLSPSEEVIYIGSKTTFMGWMFFSEDIKKITEKISHWKNVYLFNKIEGIKVRGDFEMGSIMIYK